MQTNTAAVNAEKQNINGVEVKTFDQLNVKDPQPGIYDSVPFEIYKDLDALNSSKIRKALKSMLVYKRYMASLEQEEKPSYALEFGKAFAALCEDSGACENIIKAGPTKTEFTIAWMKEIEENPDNIYVKEKDIPMLKAMIQGMKEHPYVKRFTYDAFNELTVIWVCEHTKQLCKARIDIFKDGDCIDIKTTADIRPHKFKWQIIDFRYDVQVCFYADGLRANGVRVNSAMNFFIEKQAMFADVVAKCYNEEQMNECQGEYVEAIKRIIEAEKTGVYPGYAPEPLIDLYGFDEPTKSFD